MWRGRMDLLFTTLIIIHSFWHLTVKERMVPFFCLILSPASGRSKLFLQRFTIPHIFCREITIFVVAGPPAGHIWWKCFSFCPCSEICKLSGIKDWQALITLYGSYAVSQHLPYGCGVLFIWFQALQSLRADELNAPHFLYVQWITKTILYHEMY